MWPQKSWEYFDRILKLRFNPAIWVHVCCWVEAHYTNQNNELAPVSPATKVQNQATPLTLSYIEPPPIHLETAALCSSPLPFPSNHLTIQLVIISSVGLFWGWEKAQTFFVLFPTHGIPGLKGLAPGSDPRDEDSPSLSENRESFLESVTSTGLAWKPVGFILPAQVWLEVIIQPAGRLALFFETMYKSIYYRLSERLPFSRWKCRLKDFVTCWCFFIFESTKNPWKNVSVHDSVVVDHDYGRTSDSLRDFRLWTWSLDPGYVDFIFLWYFKQ